MSTVTRPKGPLPARVYWTRRMLVLVVLLGLVLVVARLVGDRAGEEAATAVTTGAARPPDPGTTPQAGQPTEAPTPSPSPRDRAPQKQKKAAAPTGPCLDNDIVVTPVVHDAHAGGPVRIALAVSTQRSAACTWEVSPESIFVTIRTIPTEQRPIVTRLWSSQECPAVLPTAQVVPRRDKADRVRLSWNGKESDSECSGATAWVMPGSYTITAVARGSVEVTERELLLEPAEKRQPEGQRSKKQPQT